MKKNMKSFTYSIIALSLLLNGCGFANNSNTQLVQSSSIEGDISVNSLLNKTSEIETAKNSKNAVSGTGNFNVESTNEASSIEAFIIASNRRIFNEYDKNKNAMIEKSELPDAPKAFEEMDKDNNKKLSFTEVTPSTERVKQMSTWIFNFYKGLAKTVDIDGDKIITAKELGTSKELEVFTDLNYWERNYESLNRSKSKGINYYQFNVFMNNLFLELSKKYSNYKNPNVNRNNKLPVVIVQGYAEPSWYFMYGIYRDLRKNDWQALYPVNLFPNITDIKEQAKIVARKIDEAKREQKVSKVNYVAHSMGGLIGRYYIQEMKGANNIDHYVSISTPHYGTHISWLGLGEAAKQMRPGSEFLTELNAKYPIYGSVKYTSIWTKTDEIVIPAENAVLIGSRIMPDIKNVGHLLILWSQDTYKQVKEALNDEF